MLSNKLSTLVCQLTPVGAQILLIDTLSTMWTQLQKNSLFKVNIFTYAFQNIEIFV